MPKKSSSKSTTTSSLEWFTLKSAPQPSTTILATIAAGIIGLLAAAILIIFQSPANPDRPLTETQATASPTGTTCSGLTGQDLQVCCQNWATSNELITPQCIGEWKTAAGSCSWECSAQ